MSDSAKIISPALILPTSFDISTREIEFKYKADDVNFTKFVEWAEGKLPSRTLEVSSWDTYYLGSGHNFEFLRFRGGPTPELTMKTKIDDKTNQNRFELNLPLRVNIDEETVKKFCDQFGFQENFRIYKQCFIYWFDKVDAVYYIVFDENMKERGRFVEIEARQDCTFESEEEAWNAVKTIENELSMFGITAANRMKRSMWDLFKKEK